MKRIKFRRLAFIVFGILLITPFSGCDTNGVNETGSGNGNNTQPVIHIVTFNSNGGTTVQAQQVMHGQLATRPANPTRNFILLVTGIQMQI